MKILQDENFVKNFMKILYKFYENLVHSKSTHEHVKHLEILFQCIHNADVMFHGSKCQIGWLFVTYLGHLFLEAGMSPSHETYGYISNDSSVFEHISNDS